MKNSITPVVLIICGPSTTGKSTLAQSLIGLGFTQIVTTTTRVKRQGEIDGVNYHFVDQDKFDDLSQNNQLVESAQVGGFSYGLSKDSIIEALSKNRKTLIVTEPSGANAIAQYCKEKGICAVKVYLDNPMDVLVQRLIERKNSDSKARDDVYKDRLYSLVFVEPKKWTEPAYNGTHHYDHIFSSFNKDNSLSVINQILTGINYRIGNPDVNSNCSQYAKPKSPR